MDDVNDEAWLPPLIEVDHITEGTVGESGTVDRNFVLPAPVVDAVWVVNLLSDARDNLGWSKDLAFLLLLFEHIVHEREEPFLEERVVLVWNE